MKILGIWMALSAALFAQNTPLDFLNHNRPMLDAHNCYPYEGKWADRIDRALAAGSPVSIEQDLAWYVDPSTGVGRIAISHTPETTGVELTLKTYFFERVRPMVEKALKDADRSRWPLIVLHFDFKSNDAPLLHAVWDQLGEYESWITTARKGDDPRQLAAFDPKPILVITEDNDAQEAVFFNQVPVGAKLRLFGSAHSNRVAGGESRQGRAHAAVATPPEQLLTEKPTNYRRWWNNSWAAVEEGGPPNAGEWTAADMARLRALVDHAHRMGYWIRFYTLDGFDDSTDRGWDAGYNFGTRDAAMVRWKAAIEAGVNFIATDQYEDVGGMLRGK